MSDKDLPSVAKRTEAIMSPLVEKTMALRLQGYSWRQCGAELDMDHAALYKIARPYEMLLTQEEAYQALKAKTMAVAMEAVAQVGDALVEGSIPHQSLPVVMGIAVDKVARLAAAEKTPERHENPLLDLLAKIHEGGGTVKLEVSQPRTLDVDAEKPF